MDKMDILCGFFRRLLPFAGNEPELIMPIDKTTGIISSKAGDIEIPNSFLHDYILQRVLENFESDRPYETEFASERSSNYGWLLNTHRRVASWLRKRGIGRGDRVAFYSNNTIEYTACLLAIWRVGAACTYIRPEMIADVDYREKVGIPRVVFASLDKAAQLIEAGFENIVVYRALAEEIPREFISFDEILEEEPEELEDVEIGGDPAEVLAVVAFSGGTTGNPKPIQLTHRNVVSFFAYEASGVSSAFGMQLEKYIQLCPFPTVHLTGTLYRIASLMYGGRNILIDAPAAPRDLCEAIQKYRVNVMTTIPITLISLMRFPDLQKYDLSSWEVALLVGGPLLPYMRQEACQLLGLKELFLRLGVSECCGVIFYPSNLPGSVGDVVPNTQVKVLKLDDGYPVTEPGVVGELCVRGPQTTIGYYNLPEKNTAAFDDEGFLHTGDLLSFDESLKFYYFDRKEEFIRHESGRMISSTELEVIILYHNPGVSEVSVIQSNDGPRAIVVPVDWPEDEEALRQDVITKTNEVIEETWKHLTGGVAFLKASDVPRTCLGKHLKRRMKHL